MIFSEMKNCLQYVFLSWMDLVALSCLGVEATCDREWPTQRKQVFVAFGLPHPGFLIGLDSHVFLQQLAHDWKLLFNSCWSEWCDGLCGILHQFLGINILRAFLE